MQEKLRLLLSYDALEKAYDAIFNTPECDCAIFNLIMHEDSDSSESPYNLKSNKRIMTGYEAFELSLDWSIHGYYLIRNDIHKKYPYDDSLRLYSDDNTTRIHYLHSRKVVMCDGIYYYRQHSASMTHRYTPMRFLFMDAFSSMKQQIVKEIVEGNIPHSELILNKFEELRWFNLIDMFRYFETNKNKMSRQEQNDIKLRLVNKLKTIESNRISWKYKSKIGYYPFSCFPIYYVTFRIYLFISKCYTCLKNMF